MDMVLLEQSFPWFGKHAGFSLLRENLLRNGCPAQSLYPAPGLFHRILGKTYSALMHIPARDQTFAAAELRFAMKMRLTSNGGHVLFLDSFLPLVRTLQNHEKWAATIHLPRRSWKPEMLEMLRDTPKLIVLCRQFVEEFSDIVPASRITVLPHGVNADFFRPKEEARCREHLHLLYIGSWLRNSQMYSRLVPQILERFPQVVFDLVVPPPARKDPALTPLLNHPAVRWHRDLSDTDLRNLYQKATAMFMPMEDSGANNAIVEALASGLPIITTDTGGIRSYGGGTIYPVVSNNDDKACLELLGEYLSNPSLRERVGAASRRFAEEQLDWPVAARQYVSAYRSLGLIS